MKMKQKEAEEQGDHEYEGVMEGSLVSGVTGEFGTDYGNSIAEKEKKKALEEEVPKNDFHKLNDFHERNIKGSRVSKFGTDYVANGDLANLEKRNFENSHAGNLKRRPIEEVVPGNDFHKLHEKGKKNTLEEVKGDQKLEMKGSRVSDQEFGTDYVAGNSKRKAIEEVVPGNDFKKLHEKGKRKTREEVVPKNDFKKLHEKEKRKTIAEVWPEHDFQKLHVGKEKKKRNEEVVTFNRFKRFKRI